MLKNGILKEKIDKYVNNGLHDKNCKRYHEEMLEAFKNATEDEKVEGKEYLRWRLSKNKYNKTDNSNNAILTWIIEIFIVIVVILVGWIIAQINSNKDEKKNYTYNSSYNYTSDYNTSVNNNTIYSSRKNYGNTSSSKITEEEKGNAVAIAQTEIKGRLKSPSSAKFPWSFDEYTITKSGKTFIVKSYVEAKNSFGTLLKINYLIKFTMTGYETYTVDSIVIDE